MIRPANPDDSYFGGVTHPIPPPSSFAPAINNGWRESLKETDPEIQVFCNFREQLIVQDDIVFKGEKIVVPSSLRSDYLNQIHQGHLGLEAMKNRMRDIFYWPALSRDVEALLSRCSVCNAYRRRQQKEPLKISKFQYDVGILLHPISSRGTEQIIL